MPEDSGKHEMFSLHFAQFMYGARCYNGRMTSCKIWWSSCSRTKCLTSCGFSLAEISSAFRRNCMKWKAAKRQVLKISVPWLRGREEASEHRSSSLNEARGCGTVRVGWQFCGTICTFVLSGMLLNIISCGCIHRSEIGYMFAFCVCVCVCWCLRRFCEHWVHDAHMGNEAIGHVSAQNKLLLAW